MELCRNLKPMPHDHTYPDGKCSFDGPEEEWVDTCPPWCTRPEFHDGECSPKPEPPYDTVEEKRGLR